MKANRERGEVTQVHVVVNVEVAGQTTRIRIVHAGVKCRTHVALQTKPRFDPLHPRRRITLHQRDRVEAPRRIPGVQNVDLAGIIDVGEGEPRQHRQYGGISPAVAVRLDRGQRSRRLRPGGEIHHGVPGEERQLCGGGRYDDLIVLFGGKRDIPAAGFSYGLERIRLALESEGKLLAADRGPGDVLVISVSPDDYDYAVDVAEQLRREGLHVEMDVRGRSVTSNFQYADKQGIPFAIVVGSEEKLASEVVLKDLASREQQRVTASDAVNKINRVRGHHAR